MTESNKSIDQWKYHLAKNPKYTNKWIDEAAKILSSYVISIDLSELDIMDETQLNIINDIISKPEILEKINISKLISAKLNSTQMTLYYMGIANGVSESNMEKFLDNTIPFNKSNYAIQALVDGYDDILKYIDEYDADQISEIYAGMKDGIDYTLYTKPYISSIEMNLFRLCLCASGVINKDIDISIGDISIHAKAKY